MGKLGSEGIQLGRKRNDGYSGNELSAATKKNGLTV